jgi:hypothetical protein
LSLLGFLTIKGAKARQSASALGQNPTMQDKKVGLIIVLAAGQERYETEK